MIAKFSTLGGGVFIEETDSEDRKPQDRCFRFDKEGRAEYAYYGDLISGNPAPRWYGHIGNVKDFVLA